MHAMLTTRLGFPRVRGHGALVVAFLIDAFGTGLYAPFSLLYFHTVVGLSIPAIGGALTVATVATLPLTPLTGTLAARVGARRLVVASQLLQALGFLGYLAVRGLPALLGTAVLVTAGARMFYAASTALIAEVAGPAERDRWYGFIGATQNVGLGGGALLAGVVVAVNGAVGYRVLIAANACSFLAAAALLHWYGEERRSPHVASAARTSGYRAVLADRAFLGVVLCNVAFALCALTETIGLPIYATEAVGAPTVVVGALFSFNTALVIGTQTVLVRRLEPHRRTRILAVASVTWAAGYALFVVALALPHAVVVPFLFVAVAVYAGGSLLHAPTATALAAASGPARLRGRYLAAYEFSWGIAAALAPALFGGFYALGPAWPWVVVAGLALVAGLGIIRIERHLPAQAVRRPPE